MSKEDEAYGAAIHWLDEDGGWYKFDGAEWKGYRAAAAGAAQHLEVCAPKPAEWRPWTRLLDASSAPHMKWFVGARTNATFTAVDVGALTHPGAVAYEHVSAIDDEVTSITRAELLVAVCAAAQALAHAGPRAFFHARVGLEHAIYALACARLAFPYTCSSLDATDGALDHRLADFAPTVCVVSADGEVSGPGAAPASRARAALRRVGAEGVAVHQIRAGDAARLSVGPLRYATPVSVDDSRPLCVVYTSGSTGKPKGAVHTHGGYTATLARTNSYVFQAKESDVFLVVATFAWITGQSYMLMAPLLARCKSVLMEGSPVGHDGLRWARVARERGVTVLKLASAFARHAMVDPGRRAALAALDLPATLRTGTFCAEPCSDDVLKWARGALCSNFFVSYWSTEHGSVVLTRRHTRDFYKDCGTKLYAVPWVAADLLAGEGNLRGVVLTRPYAGLCRTVWGNVAGYEKANWRGDAERFKEAYFPDEGGCGEGDAGGVRLGFVQGDAAVRHGDGGFTFFGRSDEVLNVSGVRVGVEELEQCAYAAGGEGIVRLAVVGAPAALEGEVPVAFVVASAAVRHGAVLAALRSAARTQLGAHAETRAVLFVSDLPFTVTGKPCRALLRAALRGEPRLEAGASARSVRNAAAYAACCDVADTWRALSAQKTVAGAKAWANAGFDGHVVLGSPLLPGTGWLDLVRRAYVRPETPDVFLTHVEFLRQARDSSVEYTASASEAAWASKAKVTLRAGSEDFVRCVVHTAAEEDGGERGCAPADAAEPTDAAEPADALDALDLGAWDADSVVDDHGAVAHYRRCAAVGLDYADAFRCVERVAWRRDFALRVLCRAANVSAALDSPLQALCALESLGRGTAFLPQGVGAFHMLSEPDLRGSVLVVAEVTSRRDTQIVADLAWYSVDACDDGTFFGAPRQAPFATMTAFAFARAGADRRPRREAAAGAAPAGPSAASPDAPAVDGSSDVSALARQIALFGAEVTGAPVDAGLSLYENGLHSLRAVELLAKLNSALGVELRAKDFVGAEDIQSLARIYGAALKGAGAKKSTHRFAHVDIPALQAVIDRRLSGAEHETSGPRKPAHREAFRALVYMIRRGFVRYTRMQYRDGLHHFLLSPPRFIDLELVVRVPGTEVLFEQTDYNRHFTVREIVRDSERGFYNLVHQTGLAHLEHYFRVMFFASRINAKFDRELLQGEAYEMRVRVGTIAGPLIDIEVEFVNALGERCFLVTWRLMLVTDATKKQMYDFERGGVFGPPSAAVVEEAPKKSLPQPRAVTFRLWLALGCLLTYIVCYLLFRHEMLSRFARALFAAALDDFWGSVTKTELGFAAAVSARVRAHRYGGAAGGTNGTPGKRRRTPKVGALSLGVELGLWTAQTPIHGLLPHG